MMDQGKPQDYQRLAVDCEARTVLQVFERGTQEEILRILQHEINLDSFGKNSNTVLFAILENDKLIENDVVGFLTHFLIRGVDPNFKDARGQTALHLAIKRRMMTAVNLLSTFKADIHIADKYGNSVAHFFIEDEYEKCKKALPLMNTLEDVEIAEQCTVRFLEFLISKDIDFHRIRDPDTNNHRFDPLHLVVEYNLPHILPILLNYEFFTGVGNKCDLAIILNAVKDKRAMRIIKEMMNFYLNKCNKEAAVTLFLELIDTCQLWSEPENKYFLTVLRNLIAHGASVNNELSREKLVFTAIHARNLDLLELFNENLEFSFASKNGRKLVHYLAYRPIANENSSNFYDYLIRNICDVNAKDECNKSALHVAVAFGNDSMVRLLTKVGADINCVDECLRTPLHEALLANTLIQLIELLLTGGADVNATDYKNRMPLHFAVQNNNLQVVQLLLDYGALANCRDARQQTPLHKIIKNVSKDIVELLLTHGADANATDIQGESLLHVAIFHDNTCVARTLIECGTSVNCQNNKQQMPLHLVWMADNPSEIVDLLVTSGADVNPKDHNSETPLHLAVYHNNFPFMLSLIQHGAFIDCKNNRQQTVLHLAVAADRNGKIVEWLLTSGVDVNAKDAEGNRPIHQIFKRQPLDENNNRIMEILLKNNAYVNARNIEGESALFFALSRNGNRMIDKLLEYSADVDDSIVRALLSAYQNELPQVFLHHLVKLEAAGLTFAREYKIRYNYHDCFMQKYYNACLREVKKLKNTSISNGRSLFDFLHSSSRTRGALYVNRDELQNLIKSSDLKQQFPIYSAIVLASYHDAMIKKPLLKPAQEALYEFIPAVLPENVDHILDYLTEFDLVNIIETKALLDGDDKKIEKMVRVETNDCT